MHRKRERERERERELFAGTGPPAIATASHAPPQFPASNISVGPWPSTRLAMCCWRGIGASNGLKTDERLISCGCRTAIKLYIG